MIAIDSFLAEVIPSIRRAWFAPPGIHIDDPEKLYHIIRAYVAAFGHAPSRIVLSPEDFDSLVEQRDSDYRFSSRPENNSDYRCLAYVYTRWTVEITTH